MRAKICGSIERRFMLRSCFCVSRCECVGATVPLVSVFGFPRFADGSTASGRGDVSTCDAERDSPVNVGLGARVFFSFVLLSTLSRALLSLVVPVFFSPCDTTVRSRSRSLFATLLAFFSLGRLFPLALCPSSFRDSVLFFNAFVFALFLRSFRRANEAVKLSRFFSSRDTSWAYRISHGWLVMVRTMHSLGLPKHLSGPSGS